MKRKSALFLTMLLLFPLASLAQSSQKMVLTFRSLGSLTGIGAYGQMGVTIKTEGFAYMIPGPKGKFAGAGEIYVTLEYAYQDPGYVNIGPLKGEGPLDVVGEMEGKFLRFYFKHRDITCKGEIIVNAPAPLGIQKEPYEDSFDPHVLAPGEQPGVKIELKDGATQTVTIGPMSSIKGNQITSWKTDFTLNGVETWRVSVEGEEIDTTQSPIRNSKLKTKSKELPIAMKYKWKLAGNFSIIGKGSTREYYEGQILFANINSVIQFEHWDLYRVEKIPRKDGWEEQDFSGQPIGGKVIGNTVRLQWPEINVLDPYMGIPRKSYLGKVPHRANFSSAEFIGLISREELPLVDGQVVTAPKSDWLKYKITLTKLD